MNTSQSSFFDENEITAQKWSLTLLIPLATIYSLKKSYRLDEVVEHLLDKEIDGMSFENVVAELKALHHTSQTWVINTDTLVNKGIEQMQSILDLTATEADLLRFATVMHINHNLKELCNGVQNLPKRNFCHLFSQLFNHPEQAIHDAIKKNGKLYRFGLLRNHRSTADLDEYFRIDNDYLLNCIANGEVTTDSLLHQSVQVVESQKLDTNDYEHMKDSVELLLLYLGSKLKNASKGTNILLYGPPGTGKTELSRLIARKLKATLYEVLVNEPDGELLTGNERMMQYLFAQALLQSGSNLIVFDEFEDSLDSGTIFSSTKPNKGWINNILESNHTPCIWICNDLNNLHDAYLRRFDVVLEVKSPSANIKSRLIESSAQFSLDEKVLKELANLKNLSPAIIETSCNVINSIAADLPEPSTTLKNIIHSALGVQSEKSATTAPKDQQFSTQYIQANHDLSSIPQSLKDNKFGARICLYGPPGTGKTAYAHWLAEQIGKPIISKKSSDLFGPYVGETEQNIAKAFKDAKDSNSVLLIDEVDSFIFERSAQSQNWENSCVNEMLTQMEDFEGVFIATTNLPDNLDQASLRRFDLKVDFDFLSPKQVRLMLADYCQQLALSTEALANINIEELAYLTPGDFAAVKRRSRFSPIKSVDALVDALKVEMSFKEQAKQKKWGFV